MKYDGPGLYGVNPPPWASGVSNAKGQWFTSPTDNEIYQKIAATGTDSTDPADDIVKYVARSFLRVTALPVRTGRSNNAFNDAQYWANGATKTTPASISAGVRTQLLSLTGRANLQFAGVYLPGGNPGNTRLEVLCDGRSVLDTTLTSFTGGEGFIMAGMSTDAQITVTGTQYLIKDYAAVPADCLPFRRSCQIWMTPTNALASPNLRLGHIFRSEA